MWQVLVNEIGETRSGFWNEGGFWGLKHERTFSSWMGGKKIVKRKTLGLHGNLYILISQEKEEQMKGWCVVSVHFSRQGTRTLWSPGWVPGTQAGHRGSGHRPRTPHAFALAPLPLICRPALFLRVSSALQILLLFFFLRHFTFTAV